MTKDLLFKLQIKNNHLASRRKKLNLTQADLAKYAEITIQTYQRLESLKTSPLDKDGIWTKSASKLAMFFSVEPEELFPDVLREVKKSKFEIEVSALEALEAGDIKQLTALPDDIIFQEEFNESLGETLKTLYPREQTILKKRFGLEGEETKTLDELGHEMGISRNRVMQIEAKALRKLRHPSRAGTIRRKQMGEEL